MTIRKGKCGYPNANGTACNLNGRADLGGLCLRHWRCLESAALTDPERRRQVARIQARSLFAEVFGGR